MTLKQRKQWQEAVCELSEKLQAKTIHVVIEEKGQCKAASVIKVSEILLTLEQVFNKG